MSSILVLDDRRADRELLAILLRRAGYDVSLAPTGETALAAARSDPPDLVITDILMPVMNGYEFVRRLRAHPETGSVPVVFYTANYLEREVKRLAAACGVSHFIAKPSDVDTILATIGEVIGAPRSVLRPLPGGEFDREQLRLLNDKLVEKVAELEALGAERRKLVGQLINAHEQERKRIAEDLHDDSVQAVVALRMRLETLAARVGDPGLARELAGLEEHAAAAVDRLRGLLFEIQPVELDTSGVAVALRTSLERASAEDGLDFELVDRTSRPHGQAVRSLLYRVGREALANVRNHAGASRVEVRLEDDGEGFALEVRDDGRGFDPEQGLRVRPGHLGLPAMRERVEITGGRLELESRPGSGTALRVWLPDVEAP
ncbi:MAG: response regulator [Thermoleophilaceae bacterium]|nr:response regulator [Thermoleophilaceae bacterium]